MQLRVRSGGVAEDLADGGKEGVEGAGVSSFALVTVGEVSEEGAAGVHEEVVADVQDPESDHEDGDGTGLGGAGIKAVAGEVAKVGGEADEDDGDGDEGGAGGDEGAAAAEARGAAVAVEAGEWLHHEAGDGAAEPYVGCPFVWDA